MDKIPLPVIVIFCVLALLLIAVVITGRLILSAGKGVTGSFQYMILLGAKVEGSTPSPILQDRINAAYTYLSAHQNVICVVSGGKANENRISEAKCMYDGLVALGIDPQRIWLEDKAINTKQNIRYSMALIEEKIDSRPDSVGILSSDTHLLRAKLLAKRQGISAITVPAPSAHRSSYWKHFLREIPVIWYYWLIGL